MDEEDFDPPMDCPTGLGSLTLDQPVLDVNEMIWPLQRKILRVERYQVTSHPNAFPANAEGTQLRREKQVEVLASAAVRGKVIKVVTNRILSNIKTNLNGAKHDNPVHLLLR